MILSDAIEALRSLDLPAPRRSELLARAIRIDDPTELRRFVYRARAEEARAADEIRATARRQYVERARLARERAERQETASSAPQGPSRRREPGDVEEMPEPRPITVRYVTPRKPEAIRERKRAEGITGARQTRKNPPHGLPRYKLGCRCDVCKRAKQESRGAQGKRAPNGSIPEHGTLTSYVKRKCRCDLCRTASAKRARERRAEQRHESDV